MSGTVVDAGGVPRDGVGRDGVSGTVGDADGVPRDDVGRDGVSGTVVDAIIAPSDEGFFHGRGIIPGYAARWS